MTLFRNPIRTVLVFLCLSYAFPVMGGHRPITTALRNQIPSSASGIRPTTKEFLRAQMRKKSYSKELNASQRVKWRPRGDDPATHRGQSYQVTVPEIKKELRRLYGSGSEVHIPRKMQNLPDETVIEFRDLVREVNVTGELSLPNTRLVLFHRGYTGIDPFSGAVLYRWHLHRMDEPILRGWLGLGPRSSHLPRPSRNVSSQALVVTEEPFKKAAHVPPPAGGLPTAWLPSPKDRELIPKNIN